MIIAATHLDAVTFQICSQSFKIMPTALFAVWLLDQYLSPMQWASLPVLAIGVVFVTMNTSNSAVPANRTSELDLLLGLGASALSGLSSAYAGLLPPADLHIGNCLNTACNRGCHACKLDACSVLRQVVACCFAAGSQVGMHSHGMQSFIECPAFRPVSWINSDGRYLGAPWQSSHAGHVGHAGHAGHCVLPKRSLLIAASIHAGVYFEKYVKGKLGQTLWIRNLQLSIYGVPLSLLYTILKDGRCVEIYILWFGYSATGLACMWLLCSPAYACRMMSCSMVYACLIILQTSVLQPCPASSTDETFMLPTVLLQQHSSPRCVLIAGLRRRMHA